MSTANLLLFAVAAGYLASSIVYVLLLAGATRARTVALWLAPAVLLLHTAAIGVWCVQNGSLLRHPGMPFSLVAYFLLLTQLGANLRGRWITLGAASQPMAFLLHLVALSRTLDSGEEAGGHPLLRPHVLVLLLSFAVCGVTFSLAILYLLESSLLKQRQTARLSTRLPSLQGLTSSAHWFAIAGFLLLTLGIISGAMLAPQSWGPYWYLDPRTISTIIAWLVYAAYVGGSYLLGWQGKRPAYLLVAAFLVLCVSMGLSVNRNKPAAAQAAGPAFTTRSC